MSLFADLLSPLSDIARKARIQKALDDSPDFSNVKSLREAVAGRNIEQTTSFLERNLKLSEVDASTLAGLLAPADDEVTVTVIRPALDKDKDPERLVCTFSNEEDYKNFTRTQNGILSLNGAALRFRDLKDNGVYMLNGFWTAVASGKQRQQAEDKALEVETSLAVETALGADAHTHHNVKVVGNDSSDLAEYDGVVVHSLQAARPNATAYIVESAFSPQEGKVAKLLKKVEIFKQWAPSSPHFRNCVAFVPVLGGRNWSKATLDLCAAKKVSTVTPNGAGYLFKRGFCTLLRRCPK